jgi:hypothetical protein
MEAPSEEEMRHAMEFLDAKLALPKAEFEKWANELLDKARGHYVERRKRRR